MKKALSRRTVPCRLIRKPMTAAMPPGPHLIRPEVSDRQPLSPRFSNGCCRLPPAGALAHGRPRGAGLPRPQE